MDKETLIIKESMKKLIKQNTETNEQLKKLNKPKTLQESTQENAGEILSGILIGAMDRKAEEAIAKGHNLGVGVSAKNGIDIVPGGEPSVNEADTLFGITKAFYNNLNFGDLIKSTLQVPKLFRQELETMQKNMKTTYNPFEDPGVLLLTKKNQFVEGMKKFMDSLHLGFSTTKAFLGKLKNFFTTFEDDGFMAGFVEGIGFKGLGKKISKFFSMDGMKISANLIGKKIGGAIKGMTMFIFNGIKKLGNIILSPLKGILKGIIGLPKKILGFFGGALDIIGRLLFLGGGIFALAKLTEFLRNVGPGGRKSFTEFLMKAFETTKAVLVGLKDIIMDVVIPALVVFANAIFGMVKFLAQKGLLPGIDLGEGIKKKEAARIRKELLADPTIAAMPENVREDIIMGAIRKAEEERFRKFVEEKGKFLGLELTTIFGLGTGAPAIGAPLAIGQYLLNLQKKNPEFLENVIRDFKIKESDNLFIFDKQIPNIGQRLDEIKKNVDDKIGDQSSINAGVSVTQADYSNHFGSDRDLILLAANGINYSVYK